MKEFLPRMRGKILDNIFYSSVVEKEDEDMFELLNLCCTKKMLV